VLWTLHAASAYHHNEMTPKHQKTQPDDSDAVASDATEPSRAEGTPVSDEEMRGTEEHTIATSVEDVVAQIPSEAQRRELLAGAAIGYRIVTFAIALVFALGLVLYGLYRLTHVLELFTIGLLIAMAINPTVRLLQKRGVPRIVSVLTLLILLAGVIAGLIASIGPPLIDELTDFIRNFDNFVARLHGYIATIERRFPGIDIEEMSLNLQRQGQQQLNTILQSATTIFTTSVAKVFETILVVFIIVFMLLDPEPLIRGLRSLMPDKWQPEVQRIGMLAVGKVEAWIQGSLLLMLTIGGITTLALYMLGVPYALLWGVLAGFLEIVPTVGPVIAAVPPTLVGLAVSPALALKVIAAQFFIQQLEGSLLVPWIMSNKVRLHPITLLFFLLAMAQLLGIFGALIATPLAAVLKVLYMELYYRRIHGTLPEDEAEDPIRLKVLQRFAKRTGIGEPPGPPAAREAGEAGD